MSFLKICTFTFISDQQLLAISGGVHAQCLCGQSFIKGKEQFLLTQLKDQQVKHLAPSLLISLCRLSQL